MIRVLKKRNADLIKPSKAASGFDYPTSSVGQTTVWKGSDGEPVNVYYDPATGPSGLAVAQYIVANIDAMMAYCDWAFGIRGEGGNIIVAPDFGGAYHYGCDFVNGGDWYESLSGNGTTLGLCMAEIVESYMGLQNRGWNCGGSGGEGLSRFLAEVATGGADGSMSGYSAGPSWDGRDWIGQDQGTDQDYPSTGCAVLYCWWMTKLGFSVAQIVQAGEPNGTLATNYAALTGKPASQAFADFKAAVAAVGGPGGFITDNPFGAANPPYPSTGGPTPPTCPAGQHWDPVAGKCVPDGPPPPPPPPPPQNAVVVIPAQTITVPHGLFGSVQVTIPGQTVPVTYDLHGTTVQASIPPWLLKALLELCAVAPTLGPLEQAIADLLCPLLPPPAMADRPFTLAIPPIVLAVLKFACAFAGSLPPPYGPALVALCAIVFPKTAAKPCAGCS